MGPIMPDHKNENLPGCADLTRSVAGIVTSKVIKNGELEFI